MHPTEMTEAPPAQHASARRPEWVLVAGIGNMFFGDDGFGPAVIRHMAVLPDLPRQVRVVDYGIRGLHLAYDLLDGYDALIVIDALPGRSAPGDLTVLEVGEEDLGSGDVDPHGMAPVAVLASVRHLGGTLPPTWVVGVQPLSLDEGIDLTAPVQAAVPRASEVVLSLLTKLEVG
ncbi:hydrogenase maturation protease [soil metagenome]